MLLALHAGPRLASTPPAAVSIGRGTPSAGLTWLVRAAEVAVVGADRRSAPSWSARPGSSGWRRVWARRRTEFRDATGALVAWVHIDWVLLDARGAPTRIPAEFDAGLRRAAGDVPAGPGRRSASARRAAALRPLRSGPRSSTRWTTSTTRSTLTGSTKRCIAAGGRIAVRAVPRLVRLEYARAAEPAAKLVVDTWPDDFGWVCRVADVEGSDLLRARLEPIEGTVEKP